VKRRDVLKSFGAIAGAAGVSRLMSGCGGGGGKPGIDTVVLLMMENRSYDHWLGARGLVEGLPGDGLVAGMSNLDSTGAEIPIYPVTTDQYCVPDPPHGWDSSHAQFADGANTGFVTEQELKHPGDKEVMQYMQRADLPVTWALADEYAICDRWFCSVMGPTWPNRMYWMAATSMGMQSNDLPTNGFTAPTIYDRLDAAGVDFAIYYGDLPFIGLLGSGVKVSLDGHLRRMKEFYTDCAAGKLPPVVYLDPPFAFGDDHPPHHPIYGQQLLASVYNALASSPHWEHCLFICTFDEHGGFFDHVAPPKTVDDYASTGFDQLGFRVPTLVVGPYVKQGYVSSVVRDHTSAIKHLEGMFGTEPMTMRSSAANDLSELLDADRLAAGAPSAPIDVPAVDAPDVSSLPPECLGETARQLPASDILRIADAHPEWIARWDARDEAEELRAVMAAWARGRRPVRVG